MLKLYDPHSEVTLSVDASQYELGACIMQDGVPVAYASRKLTDTHNMYAQIEKAMMAIEFGLHRFHQYYIRSNSNGGDRPSAITGSYEKAYCGHFSTSPENAA